MAYVAENQGELIGYICGIVKEKQYRKINKEGFIEDWFVLEEYRHQGVGKKLYDTLLGEFKKAGCQRIALQAYTANKEAIDMYHRMGFMEMELELVKELTH